MIKNLFLALALTCSVYCATAQTEELPHVYEQGFRFCEGSVAYQNMILVSNFGTENCEPLNTQGRGYIMAINGRKVKTFIPADGNLSAPKGMAIAEGHLFIADVGKVVIYNLRKLSAKPAIVKFPAEDLFLNDIVVIGKMLIISVTNTGRLYGLDLSNMEVNPAALKPTLLGTVPGPNGMAVYENSLYIASYNPDGKPTGENVIYVADIANPSSPLRKLITNLPAGQYDGIAISPDGQKILFTSWTTAEVSEPALWVYNMTSQIASRIMDYGVKFVGPADLTLKSGTVWIPDLPASRVYRFDF